SVGHLRRHARTLAPRSEAERGEGAEPRKRRGGGGGSACTIRRGGLRRENVAPHPALALRGRRGAGSRLSGGAPRPPLSGGGGRAAASGATAEREPERRSSRSVRQKAEPPLRRKDGSGVVTTS